MAENVTAWWQKGMERWHRILCLFRKTYCENRFLVRAALGLGVVYLVAISAIVRSNFYYVDDLGRALWGYSEWETYSRYISVGLSKILHGSSYLTDISPLPQLLAVAVMAISSVMVIVVLTQKRRFPLFCLVAVIPVGLSPYFLECFSYKYDSPYMALSVFFAVLPLLFQRSKRIRYFLMTVVGTICMCMSYQASSGIYPMLVVALCAKRWMEGEKLGDVACFAAVSAAGYLVGLLVFFKLIMHEMVFYASTTLPAPDRLIPQLAGNYLYFFKRVFRDFKKSWLVLTGCLMVGFVYTSVRHTRRSRLLSAILAVTAIAGMAMLSFGAYAFLADPIFEPRSMYGIGVFIAILGVWIASYPKAIPGKLACFALSWLFFVFSFTVGNAYYVQSQYTDYRIAAVIQEMLTSGTLDTDNPRQAVITGTIGYAPAVENMSSDCDILRRLVPVTFQEKWFWGGFGFEHYYGLRNITVVEMEREELEALDLSLVADNMLHTIRANQECIWIELH